MLLSTPILSISTVRILNKAMTPEPESKGEPGLVQSSDRSTPLLPSSTPEHRSSGGSIVKDREKVSAEVCAI